MALHSVPVILLGVIVRIARSASYLSILLWFLPLDLPTTSVDGPLLPALCIFVQTHRVHEVGVKPPLLKLIMVILLPESNQRYSLPNSNNFALDVLGCPWFDGVDEPNGLVELNYSPTTTDVLYTVIPIDTRVMPIGSL